MSYIVETVNGCTKKLMFNFDSLDLSKQINEAVKKKQKEANLKGFRKGKAPLKMVQDVYGPQIESDAVNSFIQGEFFEAVTKENLKVVGYPHFENMNYKKGESISFDALVEIFPTIELNDYTSLEFNRDEVKVTEEDLENVKKNQLDQKGEMKEVEGDRALEKGHHAVFNFEGVKEDGSRPENMKGSEYLLEIGSGQFIPGFEDGMLGMKAGEEKNLELSFPEDYHVDELKNAKVTFEVKLLEIKEKVLPEWNDEIAKELGYDSVEDFKDKNTEAMKAQRERSADEKLHQEILEKIILENELEIPKAMVTQQEDYLKEDLKKSLTQQGFNDKMMEDYFSKWSGDVTSKAEFQVKSGLILEELGRKYEVESTDADLEAKIDEMTKSSGMEADKIREYYLSNEQMKKNMMYAIKEEKTFAALKKDLKIK